MQQAAADTGDDGQYYYYYDPNAEGTGDDAAANNYYVDANGDAYNDGATNAATTDTNGAYDPTGYDTGALGTAAGAKPSAESEQYYYNTTDPNQSNQTQGYYYQGEDGNYYYYEDPAQELLNELQDNTQTPTTTTAQQNLARSYEYDSWEPQNYGWFANILIDTFFSKPFRVYLTVLLYCAAVFVAAMGLNYTFQLLFRLFSAPDPTRMPDLQAFGYLSMFFYLSFVIVTVFCAIMDMTRNLWWQKRSDTVFWGMCHKYFSKQKPPYLVYLLIVLVTVFLPLLWGIIEAGIKKQSLLFVAQRYANVAVLATTFGVLICYVWFYWKSLVYKRSAAVHRAQRDEFLLRNKAYRNHPEKMTKTHWYHAVTVLEEFGVDGRTLRYNVIVFTVGCVPLFALLAAQALTTKTGTPSVVWGAISSICLIVIYVLAWLTLLRRKGQWAVYCTFVVIVILLVLGIVGGAIGGKPQVIGVVVVLFVACQGMITRKRKHSLSKTEIATMLKLPANRNTGAADGADANGKKAKRHVDTYLLCCRDTLLDYMCCDVQARCRRRHPDVVKAERQLAIKRIALRTDYKALLVWWVIVMFAIAFSIAMGNGVKYVFLTSIAVTTNTPVNGTMEQSDLCTLSFNANGSAPLRMYDLALLSALSYTWGTLGDTDFASWFAHVPTLIRQYPTHLPPTLNYATDGIGIRFSDFVDLSNGFHFITLNSNNRGLSLFRNLDEWGESIALQAAGAISPLINIWSEQSRAAFVQQGTFLKKWFPNSTALNDISSYVDGLEQGGVAKNHILFVGDQFNGGYAKILASRYNISFVAFNAPGTKYKLPFLKDGTQLTGTRSLWSYIDSVEDTTNTFFMPCNSSISANLCGRLSTTLDYLLESCGDTQGRTYTGI